MDVFGLQGQQLRIRFRRDFAPQAQIESDGVLGRCRRNIHTLRTALLCLDSRQAEESLAQTLVPLAVADVKKLELELVAVLADEAAVQHGYAD